MHCVAAVILVAMGAWGMALYASLPDQIPTHWDAAGVADAFSEKGVASVFGPLLIAAGIFVLVLALHLSTGRVGHVAKAERRALELTLGYVNLSMSAIFAWVSYSGWFQLSLGPLFLAFSLLAGLPVLVIYGLHYPDIKREREGVTAADEPSLDPRHWVLGGLLYSNLDDRRAFVPKPPHTGLGMTINVASMGGRLVLIGLLLLLVLSLALPFIL